MESNEEVRNVELATAIANAKKVAEGMAANLKAMIAVRNSMSQDVANLRASLNRLLTQIKATESSASPFALEALDQLTKLDKHLGSTPKKKRRRRKSSKQTRRKKVEATDLVVPTTE